jgi:hypothetical protein
MADSPCFIMDIPGAFSERAREVRGCQSVPQWVIRLCITIRELLSKIIAMGLRVCPVDTAPGPLGALPGSLAIIVAAKLSRPARIAPFRGGVRIGITEEQRRV